MKYLLATSIFIFFCIGCKKETLKVNKSYTFMIVNAAVGVQAQSNLSDGSIVYNNRIICYPQTGQPIKVATSVSPNIFIYNQANTFETGVYTLFVIGDSTNPEALFKPESDLPLIPKDKIYTTADSLVNIRFINLSPNSVSLKIKLSTATTNEVDNLPYKEMSTWRSYKATATTTNYTIQVRNASTDVLITSYTFTANATNRFKNVTLMIRGLQGVTTGTNAFGVTPINYF